jgi:PAS domain S-box-containing protein
MIKIAILQNLLSLVALTVLSGFVHLHLPEKRKINTIIQGVLFGSIAVFGMIITFHLSQGVIFDGRSVIISLCSYFFGPLAGLISALFTIAYRIYLGGNGLLMGIIVISSSFLIGWWFYQLKTRKKIRNNEYSIFILGVVVHLAMWLCLFLLPAGIRKEGLQLLSLTIILIYPAISFIIGKILFDQELNRKNIEVINREESTLCATLYSVGDALISTDSEGRIQRMNRMAEQLTGSCIGDAKGKLLQEVYRLQEIPENDIFHETANALSESSDQGTWSFHYLVLPDNSLIPVKQNKAAIRNEKDEIIGTIIVFHDHSTDFGIVKSLSESNQTFQTLFSGSPQAMILNDLSSGKTFDVNSAFLEVSGFLKEELIGKSIRELSLFKHPGERLELLKIARKEGRIINMPVTIRIKDGRTRYCQVSSTVVSIHETKYLLSTLMDITENSRLKTLKQIQFDIANAMVDAENLAVLFTTVKNRLSELIDTSNFIIALYDEYSDTLHTPFEVDENHDVPPSWSATGSLTGYVVKIRKSLLLNRSETEKLVKKLGINILGTRSECWLGVPLIIDGKSLGAIVIQSYKNPDAYDASSVEIIEVIAKQLSNYIKRKNTEKESLKLLKAVEQSPVSIMITNLKGEIEYVNRRFSELTGYALDEALGQNPRILKSGNGSKEFYEDLWATITAGKEWRGDFLNRKKNGEIFWEKAIISPIIAADGTFTHYLAIKEDITERKKLTDDLLIAKERAEESDRLKTAFLQTISHEIRTPLNGLMGFSYLLDKNGNDPAMVCQYASMLLTSGKRLLDLFSTVLDLSKIDSGTLEINITEFPVHKLMNDSLSEFREIADSKHIQLISPVQYTTRDLVIKSDVIKLQQILTNLIENALKFTFSGSVEVGYALDKDEIVFSVRDTGVGIPLLQQSKIFERFYQVDMSDSREFEGSGLGLALCKGLVETMKGRIWIESEENKGTNVYFSIPYEIGSRSAAALANEINAFDYHFSTILIAEDDDFSYTLLETVLENACDHFLRARTGVEAIELCRNFQEIEIVLMDIKMPEMSGLEATRKIKEFRPELPIIAQTAYAFENEMRASIIAGCDDYITKPVSLAKLNEVIGKWKRIDNKILHNK